VLIEIIDKHFFALLISLYSGVTYAPVIPPSTRKFDAVINEESSLAKNATAAAISEASPKRPIGI
jgi:hypothetical protein